MPLPIFWFERPYALRVSFFSVRIKISAKTLPAMKTKFPIRVTVFPSIKNTRQDTINSATAVTRKVMINRLGSLT